MPHFGGRPPGLGLLAGTDSDPWEQFAKGGFTRWAELADDVTGSVFPLLASDGLAAAECAAALGAAA